MKKIQGEYRIDKSFDFEKQTYMTIQASEELIKEEICNSVTNELIKHLNIKKEDYSNFKLYSTSFYIISEEEKSEIVREFERLIGRNKIKDVDLMGLMDVIFAHTNYNKNN